MTGTPQSASLRDVTLRDGLQLTGGILSTDRKLSIIRNLLAIGVPYLEIGSMARPDLVPPLANTTEVIGELTATELEKCWVWVATPRQVERALAAGAKNVQYCMSASESHNHANIGRDIETSLQGMPEAIEMVQSVNGRIQLSIATAFTCPFEGYVSAEQVLHMASDKRTEGIDGVVLCDTLGQAVPFEVSDLVTRTKALNLDREIVYHGHDTWGLGVANTLAAISAGATMVDGAMGGLGGCPFAPGASGNTASEDILFATRPDWFTPTTLAKLLSLNDSLLRELGEPNRSRTAQGARSKADAFEWVVQ